MQHRKVSWNELWRMEPLCISFMLRGVYDLLPIPGNLTSYNSAVSSLCPECGSYCSLQHALCTYPKTLGKCKWGHDQILRVQAEVVRKVVDELNQLPIKKSPPHPINFVMAGAVTSKQKSRDPSQYAGLQQSARVWKFQVVLILSYTSQQKWLSQTLLYGPKPQSLGSYVD